MPRPSVFNRKLADKVIASVSDDLLSLTKAADRAGVPRRTLRSWLERDAGFAAAFRAACDVRTEGLFEKLTKRAAEATEVAAAAERAGLNPNAAVGALRVECENLRWALSKLAPARYGDRVQVAGDPDSPLIPAEADSSRLALMLLAVLRPPGEPLPVTPRQATVLAVAAMTTEPAADVKAARRQHRKIDKQPTAVERGRDLRSL